MISRPANQSNRDAVPPQARTGREQADRQWRRRSPLTWIGLALCVYLAATSAAFGIFPPAAAAAPLTELAPWHFRLGAMAFGLTCALAFTASAIWIWRRTGRPAGAGPALESPLT